MAPALASLLECDPPDNGVVGIEREYRVLDGVSQPVDFRGVIDRLPLPGAGLDPGDPNGRHLQCGLLVTADGPEAEIATPPAPLAPGCTYQASAWADQGEDALLSALGPGFGLEGYSTHLNVSVRGDVVAVATLFARRFSLGMMLMLERDDSPGLLVRPRPGRLEIGGDFAEGEQLRAALTYATAAARVCERAARDDNVVDLPLAPRGRIVAAKDRPGWFVDRATFARDLYERGREAQVRQGRDRTRAGDVLVASWACVRSAVDGALDSTELAVVDAIVDGRRPIPFEALSPRDPGTEAVAIDSPFADLRDRVRGDTHITAVAISWAAVAFRVRSPADDLHVVVPRRWLRPFLGRVENGALDAIWPALDETPPGATGPRVVRGSFDPKMVLPPEPRLLATRSRDRRLEMAGAVAGAIAAVALHRYAPW